MRVLYIYMGLGSRGPSMGQLFLKCLFEVDEAARGRTIKCQVVLKRTNLIHKKLSLKMRVIRMDMLVLFEI